MISFGFDTANWTFNATNASSVYAYVPGMDWSLILQTIQVTIVAVWFGIWLIKQMNVKRNRGV